MFRSSKFTSVLQNNSAEKICKFPCSFMKFGFIIGTSMNEFNVDYDVGALEVHLNPVKHIY